MRDQLDLFTVSSSQLDQSRERRLCDVSGNEPGASDIEPSVDIPCSLCFELSSYRVPHNANGAWLCRCCLSHYCSRHINPDKKLCFRCIAKGRW